MVYVVCRFICWVYCVFFLPTSIKDRKNIPARGGFILASNHASYLDPIILGVTCPRFLSYVARDTLFENPFFGWLLRHLNVCPIKRSAADVGAIKQSLRLLKNGEGLVVFPEGTRSPDGSIGEGQEGVGFLARKSGLPVVPAYVGGTQKAMPKGSRSITSARLKVVFGRPMYFSEDDGLTDKDRVKRIMKQIVYLRDQH